MNLLQEYSEQELRETNANLLPLKKKKWKFNRGARTEQHYVDSEGNVNAKETYIYTWSEDGRQVIDFTRSFVFMDDEGEPLFDEIDTTPDKDAITIEEINEAIRARQIRYLRTTAKSLKALADTLPASPFKDALINASSGVNLVLGHYSVQINLYEKYGTTDWEDAMDSESDPTILFILDSVLRQPDVDFPNGLTGRQSILFQITGVKP